VKNCEIHAILIVKSCKVYTILVVKSNLIKLKSKDKPTFVVVKCNKVISFKFKVVKFIA